MNIVFLVPDDYLDVGGIKLPVNNHTKQLNALGNNVEVFTVPYHIDSTKRNLIRNDLLEIIRKNRVDVILSFGLNISYMMITLLSEKEFSGQKISYMVDSMRLFSVSRKKNAKRGEFGFKDRIKEYLYTFKEKKCLQYYKKIIYVSNVDKNYVLEYYNVSKDKVFYVPNGTNIPSNYSFSALNNPLRIGCLTGFSKTIIQDNLNPIINEIFPDIHKNNPETRLVIAGKGCPEDLARSLIDNPDIDYLGYVESLDDFYNNVDVVLTTVKKECGIINRILEAWSYGKAVVGYERNFWTFIQASNGTHYIVAETPSDFSNTIASIQKGIIDISAIGKNASNLIRSDYTWDVCSRMLNNVINGGVL